MTALELVRLIKKQTSPWWLVPSDGKLVMDALLSWNSPTITLLVTGPGGRELIPWSAHVSLVDKIRDGVIALWLTIGTDEPRPWLIVRDDQYAPYAPSA